VRAAFEASGGCYGARPHCTPKGSPVAENVLNRHFTPSAPNRAWVCDITYVRTDTGWLYLWPP